MNVYYYTALMNPYGCKSFVEGYGLRAERNPQILAKQVAHCVSTGREDALDKFASIHPDIELFQGGIDKIKAGYEKEKKDFMEKHFFNANGQSMKSDIDRIRDSVSNREGSGSKDLLIVGGLMLVGLALVLKR